MVPWAHSSSQTKWHLDRFSRFCRAHCLDRPTDPATRSVTVGSIYVCSTVMWPDNIEVLTTGSFVTTNILEVLWLFNLSVVNFSLDSVVQDGSKAVFLWAVFLIITLLL